jgi:hypothetical protein
MTFPVAPAPRTWTAGDFPTTGRLRADPGNLAWLLTQRPILVAAQTVTGQSIPNNTITPVDMDAELVDNWNGHEVPNPAYAVQLQGWYLAEGQVFMTGTSTTGQYVAGIQAVQNSVTTRTNGQMLCANGSVSTGPAAADLLQYNPATSDTIALYAFTGAGATAVLVPGAYLKTEWCGLVGGTVVSSPQPAALWPPGAGTTITNAGGIAAAATSMTVASATGIVTGGTAGLDYYQGAAVQPYAEQVTVTSVAGTTIGITATSYPHLQNAPVAVPVSAAFMNQQIRDIINFLAYPPMARITGISSAQTLPTQTFPAGTVITFATTPTLDNFSGYNGSSQYTFPVAGVYYVYGQVPIAGTAAFGNLSAGIAISGGTIQWGDSVRSQTAIPGTATVRKHVRVTAGQTLQLYGHQDTGAAQAVGVSANAYPLLLVVWRGF